MVIINEIKLLIVATLPIVIYVILALGAYTVMKVATTVLKMDSELPAAFKMNWFMRIGLFIIVCGFFVISIEFSLIALIRFVDVIVDVFTGVLL